MSNNYLILPVNPMNIQILRGLSTNNSLLSCAQNGGVVDLWSIDDGSGRQQWNVQPVPGYSNVFNILVAGGTSGGLKYLSCTQEGVVDLWTQDDGSGRQRWVFTELTLGPPTIPSYYNIQVVGGVNGNLKYLSCAQDGSAVNLWSLDDGSGRQRWQLQ